MAKKKKKETIVNDVITYDTKKQKKKKKSILDKISSDIVGPSFEDLNMDDEVAVSKSDKSDVQSVLPSSIFDRKKEKKKDKKNKNEINIQGIINGNDEPGKKIEEEDSDLFGSDDDFFSVILGISNSRKSLDFEKIASKEIKKRKKGKKDKKDGPTDFNKKFEPQLRAYDRLAHDQEVFTRSLQDKYDQMDKAMAKSTYRGIPKNMTDLAGAITSARHEAMTIQKEIANIKKTAAELTFKEKEKFGKGLDGDDSLAASNGRLLKDLISQRSQLIAGTYSEYDDEIYDEDRITDDIIPEMNDIVSALGRSSKVDTFFKYQGVLDIVVQLLPDGDYEYVAYNKETGEEIDDYDDLPNKDEYTLTFYDESHTCKDQYNRDYRVLEVGQLYTDDYDD